MENAQDLLLWKTNMHMNAFQKTHSYADRRVMSRWLVTADAHARDVVTHPQKREHVPSSSVKTGELRGFVLIAPNVMENKDVRASPNVFYDGKTYKDIDNTRMITIDSVSSLCLHNSLFLIEWCVVYWRQLRTRVLTRWILFTSPKHQIHFAKI